MLRISSISASIRLIRFPCFRYFLRYDFFALFSFFKFSVCNGIHLRCNVILLRQIFRNAYALIRRSFESLQRLCIMPALQLFIMLLPRRCSFLLRFSCKLSPSIHHHSNIAGMQNAHKHHADPVHFIAIRMVIAVIIQIQIFFTTYIVYLSSSIYPLYLSGSGIHAFISFQSFPLSKQCPTISMLFSSVHTLFPSVTIISSPSSGIGQSR